MFASLAPILADHVAQANNKGSVIVLTVSAVAVLGVALFAVASIFIVYSCKSIVGYVVHAVWLFGEVLVALVAAFTSGATVSLSILVAAAVSAYTLPPSCLRARVGVAVGVSSASVVCSAIALLALSPVDPIMLHTEVAAGIISAAAMAVGCAAAWAVGVMSLIEKETHNVGLRLTSVLDAVRHNSHHVLWLLVKLHPIGIKQRDLDIALQFAVKAGFSECMDILLNAGANVNSRDSHENSPLTLACEIGATKIARALIDRGAEVNLINGLRRRSIHHAAKWGYQECVDLLLSHGAEVNVVDSQWRTPLMLAAGHAARPEDTMRMLIAAGSQVNVAGLGMKTALHFAALRGQGVDILLDAGASVDVVDTDGEIPIHLAAREGHSESIKLLLNFGADPEVVNNQGKTALHLASYNGSLKSVKTLLDAGASPHKTDVHDNLPIYYASEKGHLRIVQEFIKMNVPFSSYT